MAKQRRADTVDAILEDIRDGRASNIAYLNAPFPVPYKAKVVKVEGQEVVGYRFSGNLFNGFGFFRNFARVASLLDEQLEQSRDTATKRTLVGAPSRRSRGPKYNRLGADYTDIGVRKVMGEGNSYHMADAGEPVGPMKVGEVLRASANLAAAPLALKAYRAIFGKTNMGPGHNMGHSTRSLTAQRVSAYDVA